MQIRELFERVRAHLLTQGKKSIREEIDERGLPSDSCLYRGPDGTSCAVGCLIKDEFYTPELEQKLASSPLVRSALECSLGFELSRDAMEILGELQAIHDDVPVELWSEHLERLAHDRAHTLDRRAEA